MTSILRRLTMALAGVAIGLVALAGPASAHTEAEATAAAAGRTRITLRAEAECGGGALPTSGLRVQLPQGATDVVPSADGGWSTQVSAAEVSWAATSPPPGTATFTVEMVLAQPAGTTVYLPAIQQCPDGAEIAWIQVPASPGENLETPAPSIVVPANATTPTTTAASSTTAGAAGPTTTATMALPQTPVTEEGSSTNTGGLVVFIVVVVVILGGGALLYLRHRGTGRT